MKAITGNQVILYLREDVKANLEMTLVHALSVSQLKVHSSPFDDEIQSSLIAISSNLLACKGVKEQAESPLLETMLQFNHKNSIASPSPLCFSNFINLQNLMNKQYVLSNNQAICFAQMHQSFFIEQNRKILKNLVTEISGPEN